MDIGKVDYFTDTVTLVIKLVFHLSNIYMAGTIPMSHLILLFCPFNRQGGINSVCLVLQ